MTIDSYLLSRLQFAANISFHILFPSITIGLAWVLFYFRLRHTHSKENKWDEVYYFWVKIFALTFAIGAVSGITMSFQFGTNWPGFMEKVGNIAGPLLGYEVLTAFFLEASFLGIMLFGRKRVSNRVHLICCGVVALGTSISSFWIVSLNSWMQTPAGYILKDGIFYVGDWWEIIFNPSFPYRFLHMFISSFLTCAFLMAGISAWQILKGVRKAEAKLALRTGILLAAILAPTQALVGDQHGLNTLKYQPAKIAAVEAVWETKENVPMTVFGIPNEKDKRTDYAVEIPFLTSLILTHTLDGEVQGLNEFNGEHPPVNPVFWSFRVMVGTGVLMILISWWASWFIYKKKTFSHSLLKAISLMTFSGWVAVLAGWYVTEVGRQPWIVYGLLKTKDVVAPHPPEMVLGSFITWLILYVFILIFYIATLRHLALKPAQETEENN